MSQENENIEVEEVLEEEVIEESSTEDTEIDWKERALKAEQAIIKNKHKKQKPVVKEAVSNYDSQVDLLRFNGLSNEEIDQLKKIAKLEDTDLIDARKSEYFTIWKAKEEKDKATVLATTSSKNRGTVSKESKDQIKARVMNGTASKEDYLKLRKN